MLKRPPIPPDGAGAVALSAGADAKLFPAIDAVSIKNAALQNNQRSRSWHKIGPRSAGFQPALSLTSSQQTLTVIVASEFVMTPAD